MEEQRLQHRFMELAERAYSSGHYTYTNFLNLMELDMLSRIENDLHVPHTLWGGAGDCERKLIRFGDYETCGYEEESPIACVRIRPANVKFADALTHRDFLGAIMNLGIERETIGDIRVTETTGYVFCLNRIAPFLIGQLKKVRHTTVACGIVQALPETATASVEDISLQVASERLDAVLAHLYKLSRTEAQELFRGGRIFVNDRMQESCSCAPKAGDIISARGYGRFLYCGVSGRTKKGKLTVCVKRYV
ncbi:MAG TPA: YlmH/Sll1252 family protein [Feifaniaceae bacterium]|nr:YlmH/Sll1252 family protein [Feifaniaceae bacterium]